MKEYEAELTPRQIKERHTSAVAAWLGAVLSVILCAVVFLAALSGVLRYALSDGTVRRAATAPGLCDAAVPDGDGTVALSAYIASAIAEAGRDAGIIELDAKRMTDEATFREKTADLVVTAKNGGEREPDLSFAADWIAENAASVKYICGKEFTDGEIASMREELKLKKIDLGATPAESDFVKAMTSNGLFFVFCALFAGALPAILVAGNFKAGFFFLYSGIALLVSGIALSGALLYALIKSVGAGIVTSAAVSGATTPSMIVAGGVTAAGLVFVVISGIISKLRERDE